MKSIPIHLLLLGLAVATGLASAHSVPQHRAGKPLASNEGYTLYTYDPDGTSSTSQCVGTCAAVWPPYIADADSRATGDFTLATRADGKRQWVYKHQPLYQFAGDSSPGDRDGDGVNGSWHLVH
jgi:predicted lipoprotein with Yx(FWY)xxD motif